MIVKVVIERGDDGYYVAHCPALKSYPPQPVVECAAFVPRAATR